MSPQHELPDGLAAPARRALIARGITTLEGLAAHTRNELLELHGVGRKAISQMEVALRSAGLSFAPGDSTRGD